MALRRSNRIRTEPSSSTSSIYLNHDYKETHEKFFSKKNVISERFIEFDSFPKYPIQQCFSGENMITSLLHIRGPAPLAPVRLFYSQIHLFSKEEQFFQTYIEGKTHRITPDVIATLLGLKRPSDPVPFPPCSEDELIVSKDEFKNAVYLSEHRDAPRNQFEITVKHLKPIIIPLVKICQSNILPRLNHHYLTNLDTVYLSFLLLNGYPVDLSYVIWHTMASVVPFRGQTRSVPYGIIVGRLLHYLGHPFPADTPCTDVPTPLNAANLYRSHLPFDPQYFKDGTGSEPRAPIICPPDDVNKNELPLPNDSPAEFSASFDQGCLSEPIQSIQHTRGVIIESIQSIQHKVGVHLSRFEQQREEFREQREIKDDITRDLDHLAQCHARYHAMVTQYVQQAYPDQAISDDGKNEDVQQASPDQAISDDGKNEDVQQASPDQAISDDGKNEDVQQASPDQAISDDGKNEDVQQASPDQAISDDGKNEDVQQASPDQAISDDGKNEVVICQKCGVTGFAELLIYCKVCHVSAEHFYCLDKIPERNDNEVIWSCEECVRTASLKSQQD